MDTPAEPQLTKEDLATIRRLKSLMNVGELTKEEFINAFTRVVEIILKIQNKIVGDNADERKQILSNFDNLSSQLDADFAKYKKDAQKFVEGLISDFRNEIRGRLDQIDADLQQFRDERSSDKQQLYDELKTLIPTVDDLVNDMPKLGFRIRDALELLTGKGRLKASAIDGLDVLIADAMKNGKKVDFVGGARGIYVYIGGVKKGVMNTLNFAPGTGVSLAYSKVNGLDTLTINATGSGTTVETPTGAVNAVNAEFTPTAQPKWVVADGTTYYDGAGYTWNGGTGKITMDIPPSSFIRVII